jgi:group I intron endonuclease
MRLNMNAVTPTIQVMNTGIYEIVNTVNGKRYVGSAALIKRRWKSHRTTLRGNRHHSAKLQNAWNKYGEAAFVFRVLLVCAPENLLMYEQISFDALKPEYNLAPAAGSCLGVKHREDAKTRTQPRMKGLTHSDETREKIAEPPNVLSPADIHSRPRPGESRRGLSHFRSARK